MSEQSNLLDKRTGNLRDNKLMIRQGIDPSVSSHIHMQIRKLNENALHVGKPLDIF